MGGRAAPPSRRARGRPHRRRGLLKLLVLSVGQAKRDAFAAAEADYLERLRHYARLELREVKDDAALLAALPERARLVALDERGELLGSVELARGVLGEAELHGGNAPLAFAIGGADGFGEAVRRRAARLVAFGRITLPHRLARLVLLEQLYRGFTILRGEPYHRA